MTLLQTGRQLGQAVKNVQRLRHILAVFAKYGFVDIVDRMKLSKFLPNRLAAFAIEQSDYSIQERVRFAFEELGPAFVKFGQLLSTRSDIVSPAFIAELTKLQDNVLPLPFESVKSVVESELRRPILQAYSEFSDRPLAAGSIAQVHEAKLHDGTPVVVKVQRPEIQKIIETDISLLAFLAGLLEKYIPETRVLGPRVVVDEFFRTLSYELDFVVEASNMRKMAENLRVFPEIVIPIVYKGLSTQKIITLQKLEGLRVNDIPGLDRAGIDRKRIVDIGARAFFKSVMSDGLFHGDLHGGNIFVLPGDRLGIVDFGIVGRLSQRARDQLATMVMALVSEDYETLCYQYAELGSSGPSTDFEGFQREVRNTLSPYLGLPLAEINLGKVLIDATRIATQYEIKVPGDWMIVFKAILTMEGMGRSLDPQFDLLAIGQDLVKDLVKSQYSVQRFSREFMLVARDLSALMQTLPRQIRWMFRKFNSDDFAFEIKSQDLRNFTEKAESNSRRIASSVLAGCLAIAGSLALQFQQERSFLGMPLASSILFGLALLIGMLSVFRTRG